LLRFLRDFVFTSGEVLPPLRLHYRTMGVPRRDASGTIVKGYVRDTCKKVSQGYELRLGADTFDDDAHHRTADAARQGGVNLANTQGRGGR